MEYEIIKGHPTDRECVIGAYEECELMATYRGFYDWRAHAWKLYPLRRYALPREIEFKKMTLSERDVHMKKAPLPVRGVEAPPPTGRQNVSAEPKTKAWWALPDPEGQMKLSEVQE